MVAWSAEYWVGQTAAWTVVHLADQKAGLRAVQKAASMAEMMADRWVAYWVEPRAAYLAVQWADCLVA